MSKKPEYKIPPSREGKVNLAIWTDPDRRQRLKVMAATMGRSVNEIIEAAIDEKLAALDKKAKRA